MRPKHRPQRTCIVCRQAKDKRDLVRVVRTPEGNFMIDPTGKANGRGAYLCRQGDCWARGLHQQRLAHALKAVPSAEQVAALQTQWLTELSKD